MPIDMDIDMDMVSVSSSRITRLSLSEKGKHRRESRNRIIRKSKLKSCYPLYDVDCQHNGVAPIPSHLLTSIVS
jgi:hypothetical protein